MTEKEILNSIVGDRDYLVSLRRYLHMHPELSRKEFNTASKIEEELDNIGITHQRVGETGIVAFIEGSGHSDRKIALRADIDALPIKENDNRPYASLADGVMHACGHDSHTAALIGCARFLASHRDCFNGSVVFCFQQAEEVGYGGRLFVDGAYLDGCLRTFGCHVDPAIPVGKVSVTPGPNNASVDFFRITVKGKSAHVSTPHLGTDAIYIASQIVVAVQAAVSRLSSPTEPLLIGIGKLEAGTAYNIVADQAIMEGTIRAMTPESRAKAKDDIQRIAKSQAASFGGDVGFIWNDNASPLINNQQVSKEVQKTASALFGPENVITNRPFTLTGDDFAEFIIKVPGCYAYIGSGNKDKPDTLAPQHNCAFDIDEDCIINMASLYASYAVMFLNGDVV